VRILRVVAVVALVAGCKAKEPDLTAFRNNGCLELPNAQRFGLQADPNGNGLYWFERVMARDYDGIDIGFDRLIRYDLTTRRPTVLVERALAPLHFTKTGDPIVVVKYQNRTLATIRDGRLQSLTPDWFDVSDAEPIDRTNLAVLAGADNKTSVFLLDLDRPRPVHLIDADVVLSAMPRTVFVRNADKAYAVDIATGTAEDRVVPSKAMPDEELIYFVEDRSVMMRSMRTTDGKKLVDDRRDWMLIHQTGSVLARAGAFKEQYAYLLAGGTATPLPKLTGGTSIVGTTKLGDAMWSLIGHNTANYDGDLHTVAHESDVCILDTKVDQLHIDSRTIPSRFAAKSEAFWRIVQNYPTAKWQLLDFPGYAPAVSATFDEDAGNDLDKLRARTREIHKTVTSMFGDEELVTELAFQDGRESSYRWRRERLRGRSLVGIGDVKLDDASELDVDLADLVLEKRDDDTRIKCQGKLTNLRSVTLVDLQVRCVAGDLERVIPIAKLEPKQTFAFDNTFPAKENDVLLVEVFRGRDILILRNKTVEDRDAALYDFFIKLHADTNLALREHDKTNRFYVQLQMPWKARIGDVDLATVKTAFDRIDAARALFEIGADAELELEVFVDRKRYGWDGEQLTFIE
jgi:hypothetical protein